MENKSKKMLILLGVIVVIALIIVVAVYQNKKNTGTTGPQTNQPTTGTAEPGATTGETTQSPEVVSEILKEATIVAPGASAITKDNKVVNLEGQQTVNNVEATSPLAPSESGPVAVAALAPSVIKLEVSAAGYSPKEFTVKPGAAVSVSITATDAFAHSLVFEDASLSAIGVGVYSKETRVISFNAPTKAGEYIFYCNVGNHRSRGEVGKMIVK
jgi:plastocyanin